MMAREHYDALPQGLSRWQLTVCVSIIAAAYGCVAYLDHAEEQRAECVEHGQVYSDSLDQCFKEVKHGTSQAR